MERAENPSGLVVYKCAVCGKSWSKKASLMAHMGHGCSKEFDRLVVSLPKARKDWFLDYCKRHNSTSCHVLLAMFTLMETGEKQGATVLGSANPQYFVLQEFFGSRPRGHGKYDTTSMVGFGEGHAGVLCLWCDGARPGEIFCQRYGAAWVPESKCTDCSKNRFQKVLNI